MKSSPFSVKSLALGAIALIVCASAWALFAPPMLGGSTSYAATEGISMAPRFHSGDLVLVRARGSYRAGEIVAYHSHMLGTVVLHRIVGRDGTRYLFKGDTNDFVDPEHPARGQLIGALWVHLPGAARYLASVRTPAVMGGLVGLGALLLLGGAFTHRRRRRRRRRDPDEKHRRHPQPVAAWPTRRGRNDSRVEHPGRPQPPADPKARRTRHDAGSDDPPSLPRTASWPLRLMIAGVAALTPLVLLAVLAYGKPTHVSAEVTVPYTQGGTFSYSAVTAPGPAYPHGNVSTGDPLYLRLVDALDVRFAYRFHAAETHTVSGTGSLSARIASTTGWKRTVVLQSATHFSGDGFTLAGVLNLAALPRLLHALDTSTGVPSGYTLELVPNVHVNGTVGGFPLHATLASPLPFTLTGLMLQPTLPGTSATAPGSGANPFVSSASGTTTGRRLVPASLQFKVASLRVATARTIASRGLENVLCVLLGCALALALSRRHREHAASSEVLEIQKRYRNWLVPVANGSGPESSQVVEMADMTALARIAERYERLILHESGDGGDTFSVAEDGVVYQYAVRVAGTELEASELQGEPPAASPVAPTSAPAFGPQAAAARPTLRRVPQPEKRSA